MSKPEPANPYGENKVESLFGNGRPRQQRGNVPSYGNGDPPDGKEPNVTTELIDAKIAASEARTDSKFAEVMGELRVIGTRLSHIEEKADKLKSNVWGAAGFVVASMIAVIALLVTVAPWAFDKGTEVQQVVRDEVARQLPPPSTPPAKP